MLTTAFEGHPRPTQTIPKRFLGPQAPSRNPDKFTGQLYQMLAGDALRKGDYVVLAGPHDTFGVVVGVTRKDDEKHGEHFVHLIRGIQRQLGFSPVLYWQ